MINTIAPKQVINDKILDSFIQAFKLLDYQILAEILHEEGLFLENLSKNEALNYFQKLFQDEKTGLVNYNFIKFYHGTSLDVLPYSEMLEIRFACCSFISEFGEIEDPFIDEHVIRLCFSFKENQIIDIRIPGNSICNLEKNENVKVEKLIKTLVSNSQITV
jgi:hypothetical protein